MGRFINADTFASTGQGVLGNNMFAYCLNNPVAFGDHTGRDAVVLYKSSGVGHIGLLVQDDNGQWWHFYWGADGTICAIVSILNVNVPVQKWIKKYDGDPRSLDELNATGQYSGTYTNSHYLYGDFSDVIDAIAELGDQYNLYDNNCGQVVMRLLANVNSSYQEVFMFVEECLTPMDIDHYLSLCIPVNHPWAGSSHGGCSSKNRICVQDS